MMWTEIGIKQNKEDMEENKLNLKPFDIQKAREGKPVCTRDGRKARIICFDSIGCRPIVALVTEFDDEEEIPYKYHCDGSYNCQSIPSDNDLMMFPEKKEGWVNIYKRDKQDMPHIDHICDDIISGVSVFENKEAAISCIGKINKGNEYITTIKIEWEE